MYILYQPEENELKQANENDFIKLGWQTNESRNLCVDLYLEREENFCSFA